MNFKRNSNTDYIFKVLTSKKITEMSGGRIPQMTPQQAAGLMGSWAVETGDPTFNNLDVVEKQAKAGRGLSQYTGVRRIPYDRARNEALAQGVDPNSAEWQMQYFADEYAGKYDQNGRSLIGWTKSLETLQPGMSPADYAQQITGSAAEARGYFRPGVPHTDRRRAAAEAIYQAYNAPTPSGAMAIPSVPQKQQPKQAPIKPSHNLSIDPVLNTFNKLFIK